MSEEDRNFVVFFGKDSEGEVFNFINENFISENWVLGEDENKRLEISNICLIGCQVSFKFDVIDLSDKGVLVNNLTDKVLAYGGSTGFTEGDKIQIAIIDENWTYISDEILIGSSDDLDLKTKIRALLSRDDADEMEDIINNLAVCFVRLIKVDHSST